MGRGSWGAVGLALASIAVVSLVALEAARRDRAALLGRFSDEQLARIRLATSEVEADVDKIRHDLAFAARLVTTAATAEARRSALEALVAVVREYRAVTVHDAAGTRELTVVDPLAAAPAGSAAVETMVTATAHEAMARGGVVISGPPGDVALGWYRAFAAPIVTPGGPPAALVIVVDLEDVFARLRLVASDPSSSIALLGPRGSLVPLSAPAVARGLTGPNAPPSASELVRRMRAGDDGALHIPEADAAALGLGGGEAIAAFAPIRAGGAGHWSAAVLSSTALLHAQEQLIAIRSGVAGLAIVAVIATLAAYLLVASRRQVAMRERLRHAEEVAHLHAGLLRAEKLATVGVLAAGIAHEVGTPLGVVRGRAEMLARRSGDPALGSDVRIILEEIDRISRIIRELLDFSRATPPPAVAAVDLREVAHAVAELLAFEARGRDVAVEVRVGHELPPVRADADQLKQVLVNVTLNAIQACAARGRVVLGAAPEDGAVRIEVEDDGPGIPEELRHRVFDPFFTTKKRGKGTGLGLTIAARIARSHGGDIDIQGEPGRGTRFVIRWPAAGKEDLHGEHARRAHPGGR